MQIDYHFYGIYTLCRLAGINEAISKKIAYSSQHTDDAKYDHVLKFQNGGRYKQEMSAHHFIDLKVASDEVGFDIFIPFHFLPGLIGDVYEEKLVCRQNSEIAVEMLKDSIKTIHLPFGIHRIGISLHVYADTWAHDGFNGLRSPFNEVINLKCNGREGKGKLRDKIGVGIKGLIWQLKKLLMPMLPPIGHAQAITSPDEPYLCWRYLNHEMVLIESNNLKKVTESLFYIYKFLSEDLLKAKEEIFIEPAKEWGDIKEKLENIFRLEESSENRLLNWQHKLSEGYFGFTSSIVYDDREWFGEAVKVISQEGHSDKYESKADFSRSDWRLFQNAIKYHRFYIKSRLLAEHDIYI